MTLTTVNTFSSLAKISLIWSLSPTHFDLSKSETLKVISLYLSVEQRMWSISVYRNYAAIEEMDEARIVVNKPVSTCFSSMYLNLSFCVLINSNKSNKIVATFPFVFLSYSFTSSNYFLTLVANKSRSLNVNLTSFPSILTNG